MGTWNSRGLRGSTLEEMINRTDEKYREKSTRRTIRLLWPTLTRRVRWTISELYREFRSVLTPRNVM